MRAELKNDKKKIAELQVMLCRFFIATVTH